MKKIINLKESLLSMDKDTDCRYDLTNLYEACNLDDKKKRDLAKYITAYDIEGTNKFLSNEASSMGLMENTTDDLSDEEFEAQVTEGFIHMTDETTCNPLVMGANLKAGDLVYDEKTGNQLKVLSVEPNSNWSRNIQFINTTTNEPFVDIVGNNSLWEVVVEGDTAYEVDDDIDIEFHPIDELTSQLNAIDDEPIEEAVPAVAMALGTAAATGLGQAVGDNLCNRILGEDLDTASIEQEVKDAMYSILEPTYDTDFVNDYCSVSVEDTEDNVIVHVSAELGFNALSNLGNKLDKIVTKYDPKTYFEAETSGRLVCYIRKDQSDDIVDEEALKEWTDKFNACKTKDDLINTYQELVKLYDNDGITSGTIEVLFDVVDAKSDELDSLGELLNESLNEASYDYGEYKKEATSVEDRIAKDLGVYSSTSYIPYGSDGYKLYKNSDPFSVYNKQNFILKPIAYALPKGYETAIKEKIRSAGGKYIKSSRGNIYFYINEEPYILARDEEQASIDSEFDSRKSEYEDKLNSQNIDKFKPNQKILDKLQTYRSNGSKVNVKAIKNIDKLLTYYYGACIMGWSDLKNSCEEVIPKEYKDLRNAISFRCEAQDNLLDSRDKITQNIGVMFNKVTSFLNNNNITYKFVHRNARTHELEMDRRNGRCWTICYSLCLDNGTEIEFANHTNEGGGTFGYSVQGGPRLTKKDAEQQIIDLIKKSLGISESLTEAIDTNWDEEVSNCKTLEDVKSLLKKIAVNYECGNIEEERVYELYNTLDDKLNEIDTPIHYVSDLLTQIESEFDESLTEDFSSITALADDCGKNTFKTSTRDIRFTFNDETSASKFMDELRDKNIHFDELPKGVIKVNKSAAIDESLNEDTEEDTTVETIRTALKQHNRSANIVDYFGNKKKSTTFPKVEVIKGIENNTIYAYYPHKYFSEDMMNDIVSNLEKTLKNYEGLSYSFKDDDYLSEFHCDAYSITVSGLKGTAIDIHNISNEDDTKRVLNSITKISRKVVKNIIKAGITDIILPNNITYIYEGAFSSFSELTSVTLSDSVKSIGDRAFEFCPNLKKVIIPDSVKKIGWAIFRNSPLVTVYTTKGSYAEQYAQENNITVNLLSESLTEDYIPDDDDYDRIDRNGSDEERLLAAITYQYGVDMDKARKYEKELSDQEKTRALKWYDLRMLPPKIRLQKMKESLNEDNEPEKYIKLDLQEPEYDHFTIGGKEVPYRSHEEAKAHLNDFNLKDYEEELYKYLKSKNMYPEMYVDSDNTLCVSIQWGDWKHDHQYIDSLINNFFFNRGLILDHDMEVTEDDGSDTYSATHYYTVQDVIFSMSMKNNDTLDESVEHNRKYAITEGVFDDIKNVAKSVGSSIKNNRTFKRNVQPTIDNVKDKVNNSKVVNKVKDTADKVANSEVAQTVKNTDTAKGVKGSINSNKFMSAIRKAQTQDELNIIVKQIQDAQKNGQLDANNRINHLFKTNIKAQQNKIKSQGNGNILNMDESLNEDFDPEYLDKAKQDPEVRKFVKDTLDGKEPIEEDFYDDDFTDEEMAGLLGGELMYCPDCGSGRYYDGHCYACGDTEEINESTESSWTDAYQQFSTIVDTHFPDETKINDEVEKLYNQHKGDPVWDEAYKRWCTSGNDEDLNESTDNDEVLIFKRNVELAEDADDIQDLIYLLSDGVAEDNCQTAFYENEDKDLQTLKDAVISALDIYLEDNEWLDESTDTFTTPDGIDTFEEEALSKPLDKSYIEESTSLDENVGMIEEFTISDGVVQMWYGDPEELALDAECVICFSTEDVIKVPEFDVAKMIYDTLKDSSLSRDLLLLTQHTFSEFTKAVSEACYTKAPLRKKEFLSILAEAPYGNNPRQGIPNFNAKHIINEDNIDSLISFINSDVGDVLYNYIDEESGVLSVHIRVYDRDDILLCGADDNLRYSARVNSIRSVVEWLQGDDVYTLSMLYR